MGNSFLLAVGIFLCVVVLPFIVGSLLARVLKLKEFALRMGVVLFAVTLASAPFVYQIARGASWNNAIRPGIDLAGGTNLVFEVDQEGADQLEKTVDAQTMNQMVGAIRRRLDPANQEQITVRRVGSDRIEVIIPKADQEVVENKKAIMRRLGSLEFALLANERDHRDIIAEARDVDRDLRRNNRVVASWRQVVETEDVGASGEIATRQREKDGKPVTEVLVVFPPEDHRITGEYLTRAHQTQNQNGAAAVGFELSQRGGYLFRALTSENAPATDGFERRLAILLDGNVYSAPSINEPIGSRGQISGNFKQKDIDDLIQVLNAGALDVPIKPDPISEFTISPTLGHDVQQKGVRAIVISLIAVLVFMAAYYMFAGMVADLCLVFNLILILGAMAFIKATFTLPGLAGLVLTIGMAVDANVLIFERIREELNRGSSLRMAIQNGFGKALSAIVDSNLTTLITAVVLYSIGTDQVRGFAVTLFIGILMSMFTALFFGRLIFDVFERKHWIKNLKMMNLVGVTRIDFVGKRHIAYAASSILILAGMASLFARGADNLDIDFRGGTMISFKVIEPEDVDVDNVRALLVERIDPNITLEELTAADADENITGTRLRLRIPKKTDEADVSGADLRNKINQAFSGSKYQLQRVTMKHGEIASIPGVAGGAADAAEKPAAEEKTEEAKSNPLAGGHEVSLEFSDELLEATIMDYIDTALAKQGVAEPRTVVVIEGTKGSGLAATEGSVRRYSQVKLLVHPEVSEAALAAAVASIQKTMSSEPVLDEVNSFAAEVAAEMQIDALLAILFSMVATVIYIWFRFERITFGLAAIAAVAHDVFAVLGLVALASWASGTAIGHVLLFSDFKINLAMIAAFLTIIGYSLNDTIVIFDRVREVRGKNPELTGDMVNLSVNQTLSRTLLTSFTTLIVVAILYVLGGEGIHGFAFCLLVGVVVGTYSTIYVASPILVWLMNRTKKPGTASARPARVAAAAKT